MSVTLNLQQCEHIGGHWRGRTRRTFPAISFPRARHLPGVMLTFAVPVCSKITSCFQGHAMTQGIGPKSHLSNREIFSRTLMGYSDPLGGGVGGGRSAPTVFSRGGSLLLLKYLSLPPTLPFVSHPQPPFPTRKMTPCSEITQFPSVLVKLDGRKTAIIDEFDTFVQPTLNPMLSKFAIDLTGITQDQVDAAPLLAAVLPKYASWLESHGLVSSDGAKLCNWAVCTWSDADIGGQLVNELRYEQKHAGE